MASDDFEVVPDAEELTKPPIPRPFVPPADLRKNVAARPPAKKTLVQKLKEDLVDLPFCGSDCTAPLGVVVGATFTLAVFAALMYQTHSRRVH